MRGNLWDISSQLGLPMQSSHRCQVWSALRFLCWQSAETSSLPRSTRCPRCQIHLYPSRWIIVMDNNHCQNIYEVSTHQCNYYTFAMLELNVDSDPNSSNGQKGENSSLHAFNLGENHLLKREKFTVYPSNLANGK